MDAEPHEGMERVGSYGFNICTNGDEPLNQLGHLLHFLIKPDEDILLEKKIRHTNRVVKVTTSIQNLSSFNLAVLNR